MTLQNFWRRCAIRLCALPCNGLPRPGCHRRGLATATDPCATANQITTLPDIPELFHPNFLDILLPPSPSDANNPAQVLDKDAVATTSGLPFIDALSTTEGWILRRGVRTNAFTSTGSSLLDAFQFINQETDRATINEYLRTAWKEDPTLTLKIIWSLRSIHDGKGDRKLFYRAFGWLYDNHPRTAISNLHLLVEPVCTSADGVQGSHGYWKDLLNILSLATRRELYDADQKPMWATHKWERERHSRGSVVHNSKVPGPTKDPAAWRAEQLVACHNQLVQRLEDRKYRALYIAVARLFAERLVKDLEVLDKLKALAPSVDRLPLVKEISLAGRWAPTPGGSHDQVCNVSTAIARLMISSNSKNLTSQSKALIGNMEPYYEAVTLRSFYHQFLTELRKLVPSPETLSEEKRWGEIEYSSVPSMWMDSSCGQFLKHDRERFQEYLSAVESGKDTICGATIKPHKLVLKAYNLERHSSRSKAKFPSMVEPMNAKKEIELRVVEMQWKALIEHLRAHGTLGNSMAILDTSWNMQDYDYSERPRDRYPINPAIALSLLVTRLSVPPFNTGLIKFDKDPQCVPLGLSKSFQESVGDLPSDCHYSTPKFSAIFTKLILLLALKNKIEQKDMPKRLFVFSTMQFDVESCNNDKEENWTKGALKEFETSYDVVEKAYNEAGYEVPEIVFWDLCNGQLTNRTQVRWDRKGVAVMSGHSPAMLKVFMNDEGKEEFNPLNVMMRVLRKESFAGLVVVD